jgi:hypothetical protein
VQVLDHRAVSTGLMGLGRPFEFLAPAERMTFEELDATTTPMRAAA